LGFFFATFRPFNLRLLKTASFELFFFSKAKNTPNTSFKRREKLGRVKEGGVKEDGERE
jgi:hypothetical protein